MATLTFHLKHGQLAYSDGSQCHAMPATSGKGVCINDPVCSGQTYQGPIPKGRYFLFSKDMDDPNFLHDLARNIRFGDWGDWRIRLHAAPETRTQDRTNLFLHCGLKRGSAGCIDVGGGLVGNKSTDQLKKALLNADRSELYVI